MCINLTAFGSHLARCLLAPTGAARTATSAVRRRPIGRWASPKADMCACLSSVKRWAICGPRSKTLCRGCCATSSAATSREGNCAGSYHETGRVLSLHRRLRMLTHKWVRRRHGQRTSAAEAGSETRSDVRIRIELSTIDHSETFASQQPQPCTRVGMSWIRSMHQSLEAADRGSTPVRISTPAPSSTASAQTGDLTNRVSLAMMTQGSRREQ
ncbi:hypothetical protein M011DRAFT_272681 [Sporormia fimetaria CBS 119925]|uniref:Uncharacterized protein n=1 Tax=Sporormia fimetaria CBS 119925 TaxID=1340428 RepID=A0A6A6VGG3_9PLEO|nr:hypothetical protein M011DRAFT_272681 [Sporormia fimetaria CBS 119925]